MFVERFNLKPKQYYRLDEDEDQEEENEEEEDSDLPPGWQRGMDERVDACTTARPDGESTGSTAATTTRRSITRRSGEYLGVDATNDDEQGSRLLLT